MKHFFAVVLALCCYCGHANDTLTVAEIYNFNVGDTFDYKITDVNDAINYYRHYYTRLIVSSKVYSANMDSITFTYTNVNGNVAKTEVVYNLDSLAVHFIDSIENAPCVYTYSFIGSFAPGYPQNSVEENCFERGSRSTYAKRLGKVYHNKGQGNGADGFQSHTEELIYFSNSDTAWGTPYNIANGSHLIQFLPLPEECATWTTVITTPGSGSGFEAIIEQIRTGSKTESNGRAYVELIYRCVNNLTNTFTPDTVLGYFYNDTLNKTVMFAMNIGETGNMLYSFTELNGNSCGGGGWVNISTVNIGGQSRTKWSCVAGGGDSSPHLPKVAGIGSLSGLITVMTYALGPHTVYGSLTCFSVCGEVLYPANGRYCDLLTSIDEQFEENSLSLYPNPANGQITFSNQGVVKYNNYTVYNMNGSIATSGILVGNSQQISIANLANGVYHLRAYDSNGNSVSRRFIIGAQ